MRPETPQTTERPARLNEAPYSIVYDWLAANGVAELLPEHVKIVVDRGIGAITYPSFAWIDDARGFDPMWLTVDDGEVGQPIEARIVKLTEPLTELVIEAARATVDEGLGTVQFIVHG